MKKFVSILLAILTVCSLCACGSKSTTQAQNGIESDSSTQDTMVSESDSGETDNDKVDLSSLKQGDEVSIVGQKANSTLVNENTIWLQVQQEDGTFVIYHCQMKDEYLSAAGELKMLDVVEVKGSFLSYTDMEQENTSPLVTLYDCELVGE